MKDEAKARELSFTVPEELSGLRLDKGIAEYYEEISRSRIAGLIKDGGVSVNGKTAKASYSLEEGDSIYFALPESEIPDIEPEDIPLDILYEDEGLLVVNKPKGMVVHPANGHYTGTLVNALMYHCKDLSGINGVLRPGIVHRIDKDTSGLLVVAKTNAAHEALAAQLIAEKQLTGTSDAAPSAEEKIVDAQAVQNNVPQAELPVQDLMPGKTDYKVFKTLLTRFKTSEKKDMRFQDHIYSVSESELGLALSENRVSTDGSTQASRPFSIAISGR